MPGEPPAVSESNILPVPQDQKEADLFLAIKTYMDENNNAVESLLKRPSDTKTAAYTINGSDYLVLGDSTAGSFTITLPPAGKHKGQKFIIKQVGTANSVTVDGGSINIDGATTFTLTTQYDSVAIISDGNQWWKFGDYD